MVFLGGCSNVKAAQVQRVLWCGGCCGGVVLWLRKCCCYHRCCWRAVVQGYAAAAPDIEPSSVLGAGHFWRNFSKIKANFKIHIHIILNLVEEIENFFCFDLLKGVEDETYRVSLGKDL